MDLLAYWKLKERPFEATWDTRFFFKSRDHDEALNRLVFLVSEQSMHLGMLTGEIGCGKTLTRAVFSEMLEPSRFKVVTQENSGFAFTELLAAVLKQIGVPPSELGAGKFALYEQLKDKLEKLNDRGRLLVLLFDEAQEMAPETLNELKMLTNLNGGGRHFLTIILVGQPELREHVEKQPSINQRISLRFHLNALDLEDSMNYITHRLKAAGHATGTLFAPDAVRRAYEVTQGIPRELNRLAKIALEYSWLRELPEVNLHAVETVIADLKHQQQPPHQTAQFTA